MVRVQISGATNRARLLEVRQLVGVTRLYRRGTDPELYADFMDRAEADLAVVNLELIPGVKARITP